MNLSDDNVEGSAVEDFGAALGVSALVWAGGALSGVAPEAAAPPEAALEAEGAELWRRAALSVANLTRSLLALEGRIVGAEGVAPVVVVVVVVVVTVRDAGPVALAAVAVCAGGWPTNAGLGGSARTSGLAGGRHPSLAVGAFAGGPLVTLVVVVLVVVVARGWGGDGSYVHG
ncbi:MAG TPA: hypothetical protein VGK52_03490 [Polyangia bacterium]|jgi:hypothetical protein